MADCVSGLFISLSLTKHDGSLQFVLTLVYSCETVWPPVRVIPLDAMRVIAPQWNRRKWWTWYIWNSASYICMPLSRAGVGPYGVEREIACWPDTGLELFKYAWGPSVVALGHSSKCIFICMVSVIMKRLVSFFMYDRVWFGARHWGRHRGFKTNWHNVRWSLGAFTARTFLETVFSSYALVLLAQPTRSHENYFMNWQFHIHSYHVICLET